MNWYMIALGMACSAAAQTMLKVATRWTAWSISWIASMASAAALYGLSFALYSFILRRGALSRIGPAMTVGVAALVVVAGVLVFEERVSPRHGIGLALGAGAVVLLLS